MNLSDYVGKAGRAPAKMSLVGADATTPRPSSFFQSSHFQNPESWRQYILDNPELQGFASVTAMALKNSGNPRVSQVARHLTEFAENWVTRTHDKNARPNHRMSRKEKLELCKAIRTFVLTGESS